VTHHDRLTAGDGTKLRVREWASPGAARALVVLTHGHGEHSSRYIHVAAAFNAAGFTVAAHDLRGHGQSGGPRGHVPSYAQVLNDVQLVYDWAVQRHTGAPCFLYGHSMGGQITLSFALDRKPEAAGVIVTGPWLRLNPPPPLAKVALGRVMSKLWPTFTLNTELELVPMAHDAAHLASLPDLELCHTKISARLGAEALDHGLALIERAPEFTLPVLVLHGEADPVTDHTASAEFHSRAGSADKTRKVYPGLYHEIHNEFERGQILAEVVAWMEARL
jgi:alpha-beta hydrolase superfamily lysophospholipase